MYICMHLFTSVCICLPLCLSVFLVAFLAMCLKTHVSWHYFFKGLNHDWRLVVTFWQPWWVKTQPVFVKNVPLKTTRCVALRMKHCADHRNIQRTNAELLRSVERTTAEHTRGPPDTKNIASAPHINDVWKKTRIQAFPPREPKKTRKNRAKC